MFPKASAPSAWHSPSVAQPRTAQPPGRLLLLCTSLHGQLNWLQSHLGLCMLQRACSAARTRAKALSHRIPGLGNALQEKFQSYFHSSLQKHHTNKPSHEIKPFPMIKAGNESVLTSTQSSFLPSKAELQNTAMAADHGNF